MPWYEISLFIIIVVIAVGFIFGVVSIMILVAKPLHFDSDFSRSYEEKRLNGVFTAWDQEWERHGFSLPIDKHLLHGEIVVNPISSTLRKKVMILCHGQTMDRLACVKYGRIYYRLGYHLVLYDARYFGKSNYPFSSLGFFEQNDLGAVIQHAQSWFGSDAYIGIHGESMGSATALLAAGHQPDIRFIVADCPFSDLSRLCRSVIKRRFLLPGYVSVETASFLSKLIWHFEYRKISPRAVVQKSNVPVCFIHGKADSFIPSSMSEELAAQSQNGDTECHLIDGAKHAQSYWKDPENYEKIVCEFVRKIENRDSL